MHSLLPRDLGVVCPIFFVDDMLPSVKRNQRPLSNLNTVNVMVRKYGPDIPRAYAQL